MEHQDWEHQDWEPVHLKKKCKTLNEDGTKKTEYVKSKETKLEENIEEGKKSIALNVTIQSLEKTLNEEDLNKINQLIISTVESKTEAKIRA